jgi:hypothetical protein
MNIYIYIYVPGPIEADYQGIFFPQFQQTHIYIYVYVYVSKDIPGPIEKVMYIHIYIYLDQ